MSSQAYQHINAIRERKGFVNGKQSGNNTAEFERLLTIVGEQLYQESTHFLLELIQNADDNNYDSKVVPTLDFTLDQQTLRIDCNETGFEPKNVDAICSVALSTKSGATKSQYVGEKGIGFKSVFKVADVVSISSGLYSFNFDKKRELGMIAPMWCEFPAKIKLGYTSFILNLSTTCDKAEIVRELRRLDSKSMIFLRRLRAMTVTITSYGDQNLKTVLKRQDSIGSVFNVITFYRDAYYQRYIVYKQLVKGLLGEEKRPGISESEISLAFPLSEQGVPVLTSQLLYAFLPIREYGFEFLINGDFLLTANRQDLVLFNPWNDTIIDGLCPAIVEAFRNFALGSINSLNLRYTWIRYVPSQDSTKSVFTKLKNEVLKSLADTPILETAINTKAKPTSLIYVPPKFRSEKGVPLTLCSSTAEIYLSSKYADEDSKVILNLGVKEMEFDHFLVHLKMLIQKHGNEFNGKDKSDHSLVAGILLEYLGDGTYSPDILELPIIKIRGGLWVSAIKGPIFFQGNKGGRDIPEGVDAMIIQAKFARNPKIKNFYIALGVTQLDDIDICRLIISTHLNPEFKPEALNIDDLVSHVLFLYDSNFQAREEASHILLRTKANTFCRAHNLYQDSKLPHSVQRYLSGSTQFLFLDPYYLKFAGERKDFSNWLNDHMDIWQIPRLVHSTGDKSFKITPEFLMLIKMQPASRFLLILRDCWKVYSSWFPKTLEKEDSELQESVDTLRQTISTTVVKCRGGLTAPLSQTFLPFQDWVARKFPLPLLDIPDPELEAWNFLGIFGVGVKRNITTYLQCLVKVANDPLENPKILGIVSELYDEIQSYAKNNAKLVRNAFTGKQLVFVPPSGTNNACWLPLKACTWEGPNLKHFTSIQSLYPSNARLFCEVLGLENLEIKHIILEMKSFQHSDKLDYIKYIFQLLMDWFTKTKAKSNPQIIALQKKRAFPVSAESVNERTQRFTLMDAQDHSPWFIADSEDLENSFSGNVPFLAFDLDTCLKLKPLFKDLMGLETRMLSQSVKADPQITGPTVSNVKYTKFLQGKLDLIIRLIPENCDNRKDIAARLRNVEIYGVRTLRQRWSVQVKDRIVYGRPTPAVAVMEGKETMLRIYLLSTDLQSSHCNFQYDLAELLEMYCNVEDIHFKGLIYLALTEKNHRAVSQQFTRKGVRALTQQEERDNTSYFQNIQANITKPDETNIPSISRIEQLAGGFENIKVVRIFPSRGKMNTGGKTRNSQKTSKSSNRNSTLSDLINGSENIDYYLRDTKSESTDTDSDYEPDDINGVTGRLMLVTHGAKKMKRKKKRAPIVIDEEVAIAGELFMARFLSHALPDFYDDGQHWTSERRQHAGHGTVSLADIDACTSSFTIPDNYGVFTRFLVSIGFNECETWVDSPTIYHIEAIGTEKGLNSSFPMASEWWKLARKYSSPGYKESNRPPQRNVCLLARVYNLGEDPELSLLMDPWDYFMKNRLNMEADGLYIGRIRS